MAEGSDVAQDRLRSFIERIERLEEEKAALLADIKEVYAEAKGTGFDPKTMRKVISLRKMEEADRQEAEFLLDTYLSAWHARTSACGGVGASRQTRISSPGKWAVGPSYTSPPFNSPALSRGSMFAARAGG